MICIASHLLANVTYILLALYNPQRHFAESIGKGRQACKADIEKHNLVDLTVEEALPFVTKMFFFTGGFDV